MYRLYVPETISGGQIEISDPEQLHHLRDVLRLKATEKIMVFDVAGNEFLTEIIKTTQQRAILAIKDRKPTRSRQLKVAVACAIPKKSSMDDIIDNLTQLDVDTIIPLVTERVVVRIEHGEDARRKRWRKISLSSAEQSQRNTLPIVTPAMHFKEMIAVANDFQAKLIPTLTTESKPLKDAVAHLRLTSLLVAVGPEGDFTPAEIRQAINAGFTPVSLGSTTLRVGTAAVAIVSYIHLAFQ